jgi:hypothetical protein
MGSYHELARYGLFLKAVQERLAEQLVRVRRG